MAISKAYQKVQLLLTELISRDIGMGSRTAAEMRAAKYMCEFEKAGVKFTLESEDEKLP